MTETNHGTALLCLTAVFASADRETLKREIAAWTDKQRQQAIDWSVKRLTGAAPGPTPAHLAPWLAVQEAPADCTCAPCELARQARRMVDGDPHWGERPEPDRAGAAIGLCLAASHKAAVEAGLSRRSYAEALLKEGGQNLVIAIEAEAGPAAGATRH